MGTKSHISKALPASIMTKRTGLIVLLRVTFRTGCFYLSFPGHFLYVCQHKSTALMHSCIGNNTEEIRRLCYFILSDSPLLYVEPLVYKFGKNSCAQALYSPSSLPKGSFSHFIFFSPSLAVSKHG